ncbi:MAG: ribonuclease P protein component [Elusimicrobiota bacterium]
MNETFGKENRLGASTSKVIREGRRCSNEYFVLYYIPGPGKRFSIVVSRKLGNSVKRNRLKRWAREIFRREKGKLKGCDMAVIYKRTARDCKFGDVERFLRNIWKKEKLYQK